MLLFACPQRRYGKGRQQQCCPERVQIGKLMNNRISLALAEEPSGRYLRQDDGRSEWWHVTPSERENLFRIEHGYDDGAVDLETVVDSENLAAKFRKWEREGFVRESGAPASAQARPPVPGCTRRRGAGGGESTHFVCG